MRVRWVKVSLLVLAVACGGSGADSTPVATVRHFLDAMDRSDDDQGALKEAYRLLDSSARKALARRADRARSLSLQAYEPWQMLVQGRYRLRFAPASPGGMRERIVRDHAIVTVVGRRPEEHAEVSLVREQGHWRIALSVPPMHSESSDGAPGDG